MLKGLLGGMASTSRSMTGMGGRSGSRKGSGMLKKQGLAGILGRKEESPSKGPRSRMFQKDMDLPLSGSANPEHRNIARRRMAATPRAPEKANMDKGKKKGIFTRLMEMNPIKRAAESSNPKGRRPNY